MIYHIRIFYCKQQKCTLVDLSKREFIRIFSYEAGEPGLETGRKQSSLEDSEARMTGGGSLQGPSGQDTAGGISKNTNHIFCLWTLTGVLFSYSKIWADGNQMKSWERAAMILCICFIGKVASRKTLDILQRFVILKGFSWFFLIRCAS